MLVPVKNIHAHSIQALGPKLSILAKAAILVFSLYTAVLALPHGQPGTVGSSIELADGDDIKRG